MTSPFFKIILLVFGLVVVVSILVLFIILPEVKALKETRANLEAKLLTLANLEEEILAAQKISERLGEVAQAKLTLEKFFPKREDMVFLVEGLEVEAQKAKLPLKLTLTDLKEKETESGAKTLQKPPFLFPELKDMEEIPVSLELSGGEYRQFLDFLLALENLPFFAPIQKLQLSAQSIQVEGTEEVINTGRGVGKLEGLLFVKMTND